MSSSSSSSKRSAASDSESSAHAPEDGGSEQRTHKARRVRKSTYTARKEELVQLSEESEALETQLQKLQDRRSDRLLTEAALLNAMLREMQHGQQLSFALAQSVVSESLMSDLSNPLSSYIHLSKDWDERRETLVGMRKQKLRSAFEYAAARSKFLDPLKPHRSDERFEAANGDYCCSQFDLIQFEGIESVKQVFDTLTYYLLNIEISVSEQLGLLTVREDYDSVDTSISNFRLLSDQYGVGVESHIVMFAKFHKSHALSGGLPCGIIALDYVDEDELHPYNSKQRVRKDVSEIIVLSPHMRKKRNGEGEEELVVVMTRGKFLRLHKPEMEVSCRSMDAVREGMCWGPVMVTTVNELLHPEFVAPTSSAGCATRKRQIASSSDSDTHMDSNSVSEKKPRKTRRARKSTYVARREETELLLQETAELEARIKGLCERDGEKKQLQQRRESEMLNEALRAIRREQQLAFAAAQSAVSGCLMQASPLNTYIHLGQDMDERRRTLLELRDQKVHSALEYTVARSQFLDVLKPHRFEDHSETASGDYCCSRFDQVQFSDVDSVKQVFDILLYCTRNVEISISDRLRLSTVQENYDSVNGDIANFRLLSTHFGVQLESHCVLLAKYFESHELAGGGPCGVVVLDSVDDDELFPYSPAKRVRKDMTSAIVLTSHKRRNNHTGDGDEEPIVVMRISKFLKLHRSSFELLPRELSAIRDCMCWGMPIVKAINEMLYPEFALPTVVDDLDVSVVEDLIVDVVEDLDVSNDVRDLDLRAVGDDFDMSAVEELDFSLPDSLSSCALLNALV